MKTALIFAGLLSAAISQAFGLDDITTWAGTGSNRAALVIDWNDGVQPESLVWGFRWDGTATGAQMLSGVMAADPRLSRTFGGGGPLTIFGLGYDTDGDGLPLSGAGEFLSPTDPGDHFQEGWFEAGFWGYYVSSNTSELPSNWSFGGSDFFGESLQDNDWRGFSFAPGFDGGAPSSPVNPVPEPISLAALAAGIACFAQRRKRA